MIRTTIIAIATKEACNVPKSKPPLAIGFVKKSPKVAPKGLVNINASQNRRTSLILVV